MSWIFWVVVFAWVVPIIMRRVGQDPRRRQLPPRDRGYNRYGGYPGNPYPRGYPGDQPPPNAQQGQQVPPPAGGGWWQQPIPPGSFPGQQPPAPQHPGDQTAPHQASQPPTAPAQPSVPAQPPAPADEPQGYRARKLAELDRQFTEQKISLEEYMKARNEVMRG
jgi:hypothetical protein